MNTDTGTVYRGFPAIRAAEARGEPVVAVSEKVADAVEIGMLALNRGERRAQRYRRNERRARTGPLTERGG